MLKASELFWHVDKRKCEPVAWLLFVSSLSFTVGFVTKKHHTFLITSYLQPQKLRSLFDYFWKPRLASFVNLVVLIYIKIGLLIFRTQLWNAAIFLPDMFAVVVYPCSMPSLIVPPMLLSSRFSKQIRVLQKTKMREICSTRLWKNPIRIMLF